MAPIAYRLRQQADKPRSLIDHATVPTDLLVEAANEIDRLQEVVRLADNLYVSAAAKAQKESDQRYIAEFGHTGPSLAGFLPGGADREYHHTRHRAGECPLPSHLRYMQEAE